jgi:ATP-dependent Clp protease ATP-binding subunit ClpA
MEPRDRKDVESFVFTESVRQVLKVARMTASEYGAKSIQPEHIVLALLTPAGGEPLAAFIRRTVDPDQLRQALIKGARAERRPVDDPLPDLPYSSESSQIIEGAMSGTKEGFGPGPTYIVTPLHLLAAAFYVPDWRRVQFKETETPMGVTLRSAGLDLKMVRAELAKLAPPPPP